MAIIDELRDLPSVVFTNLWEIREESNSSPLFSHYASEVTFPFSFPELTIDKLPTGLGYYKDVEYHRDFTLKIREGRGMEIYNYFHDWLSSVYDRENESINLNAERFSRNFIFELQTFDIDEMQLASLKVRNLTNSAVTLLNNAILSKGISYASKYKNKMLNHIQTESSIATNIVKSVDNAITDTVIGYTQQGVTSLVNLLRDTGSIHKIRSLLTVSLTGCLIKGVGDSMSFDYTLDSEPLSYEVSLSCDDVDVEIH